MAAAPYWFMRLYRLASGQLGAGGAVMKSTYYYGTPGIATAALQGAVGTMYGTAFNVLKPCTLDRIGIDVSVLGAGSTTRLGIYEDDGFGMPGNLILDAGTVDTTTVGVKTITIAQAVPAGRLWLAAANQGGTAPTVRAVSGSADEIGRPDFNTTVNRVGFFKTGVAAALPATFGTPTGSAAAAPWVLVRVA